MQIIGQIYRHTGRYNKAIQIYQQAALRYEGRSARGDAGIYLNLGTIRYEQGKFDQALEYQFNALQLYERIKDTLNVALCLNNIALVYADQGNYQEGLEYYSKSGDYYRMLNNKAGLALSYLNIATIHAYQQRWQPALEYSLKSLALNRDIKDRPSEALVLNNIASIYMELNRLGLALDYCQKSVDLYQQLGDHYLPIAQVTASEIYLRLSNLERSAVFAKKALAAAKKFGTRPLIREAYKNLSSVFLKMENYRAALQTYKAYIALKDSIADAGIKQQTAELKIKYETVKKDKEIELLQLDNEIQNLRLQQQVLWRNSLIGAFTAAVVLSLVITNRYRLKKKSEILLQRKNNQLAKTNVSLKEALEKVKVLSGLLPICSSCKKIRDDRGYWTMLETFLEQHSHAEFTHSICPECIEKLYPQLSKNDNNKQE